MIAEKIFYFNLAVITCSNFLSISIESLSKVKRLKQILSESQWFVYFPCSNRRRLEQLVGLGQAIGDMR